MTIDTKILEIKLVRQDQGIELNLLPLQGLWTEEQYLKLTNQTNHLIEFTDGEIEVLAMPTRSHQLIVRWLFLALFTFLQPRGGLVLFAPLRLQIRPGKQREPDILLVRDPDDPRNQEAFWLGADLVVEVVSPDDPERDIKIKRGDYADAGIPEYWIVNPLDATITVLTLDEEAYREHGIFHRGDRATSHILEGFHISVDEVFNAH
ncbi:MAG: type II toxin-antitoxin system Phd/YefM family antitoxin [Roseiflexaceae bacterium]